LEFNVPFQHKYGYIRDDNVMGNHVIYTAYKNFCKKPTAIKMKADVINTDISANNMHCLQH